MAKQKGVRKGPENIPGKCEKIARKTRRSKVTERRHTEILKRKFERVFLLLFLFFFLWFKKRRLTLMQLARIAWTPSSIYIGRIQMKGKLGRGPYLAENKYLFIQISRKIFIKSFILFFCVFFVFQFKSALSPLVIIDQRRVAAWRSALWVLLCTQSSGSLPRQRLLSFFSRSHWLASQASLLDDSN